MASKMKSPSGLIHQLCDSLQTNLRLDAKTEGLTGFSTVPVKVGDFWSFDSDFLVSSDETSPELLSAFVRLYGALWAYVVVRDKQGAVPAAWLYYVDGALAKLRVGAASEVGTGSASETIKKLKPALVGPPYQWSEKDMRWKESPPPVPAA